LELEVHETIISSGMFKPKQRVVIGVSGGKDSTVLGHIIYTLNNRYNYGIELLFLSIDEGISGYRDESLKVVELN